MADYNIAETFTLPSRGLLYSTPINPEIKLRSMTTNEEMKRLAHSENNFDVLSEVIDDCIINKPEISSYDMCIGDFQFLLHKLRVVTYGSQYKSTSICPICGHENVLTLDLNSLEVKEFEESSMDLLTVKLPRTGKTVQLRVQSPRMLDNISRRRKEIISKNPQFKGDPSVSVLLESLIKSVDGEVLDPIRLGNFVRSLPMMDVNKIIRASEKFNKGVGVNPVIPCTCSLCGVPYDTSFRITAEFFGPTDD